MLAKETKNKLLRRNKERKQPKVKKNVKLPSYFRGDLVMQKNSKFGLRSSISLNPNSQIAYENKDKKTLIKASETLLEKILSIEPVNTHRYLSDVENYTCSMNNLKINFFNLEKDFVKETNGYQSLRILLILQLLSRLIISRFEEITSILIFLIQISYSGFDNFFIIGIILFNILMEAERGRTYYWKVLFGILLAKTVIKYGFASISHGMNLGTQPIQSFFYILFANYYYYNEIVSLILIFFLIQILEAKGMGDRFSFEYEDPGSANSRIIINHKKEEIYHKEYNSLLKILEMKANYLIKSLKKMSMGDKKQIQMEIIKITIRMTILKDIWMTNSINQLKKYFRETRNDLFEISEEKIKKFRWRNFSYLVKIIFNKESKNWNRLY